MITIGVVALLSALFLSFFYWFLGKFAETINSLGSDPPPGHGWRSSPYSSVFYSHELAAGLLFIGFALVFLRVRGEIRAWALPAAGFLLGFALLSRTPSRW